MNDDNKKMLGKVKEEKTNEDAIKTLLTDPDSVQS